MTGQEDSKFNSTIVILPIRMEGVRMDIALSEMLPNLSRSKITSTIKAGDASVSYTHLTLPTTPYV